MTIYRNGLSVARPSGKATKHAIDLAGRFSFQPYSEDTEEDDDGGANRRALHDKRLLEELYEQLAMQDHLETSQLSLNARNGVVTIDGSVSDHAMRAQIGNFIRHGAFVKSVINRLQTREASDAQQAWQIDSSRDTGRMTRNALRPIAA